ncbi:MAG: hypothetical protein ABEH81_08600 [Halopenitus sp.]
MPVDATAFSEQLATLSAGAATALVADLWSARGRDVEQTDGRLVLDATSTAPAETLAVVTDGSDTPPTRGVDTVVTTVDHRDLDVPPNADVVGPEDLFQLLKFGVEPDHGERLLAEYFENLPAEFERSTPAHPDSTTDSWVADGNTVVDADGTATEGADGTATEVADGKAVADADVTIAEAVEGTAAEAAEAADEAAVENPGGNTPENGRESTGTEAADTMAPTESPSRTPTRRALLLTGGAVVAGLGAAIATGVTTNAQPTVAAPGVTAGGVVDATSLGAAHVDGIAERSYSLALDLRISGVDERLRSYLAMDLGLTADRTCRTRVSTSGEEAPKFLGEPPATAEFWSNGETHLVNYEPAATESFTEFQSPDGFVGTWKYWAWAIPFGGTLGSRPSGYFETVFDAVPTRLVERRETADGPLYRVANDGRELTSPSSLNEPGASNVRNVRLDALIDSRGVVRSFELDFAAELDGEPAEFSRRMAYTAFGETTVERPPEEG